VARHPGGEPRSPSTPVAGRAEAQVLRLVAAYATLDGSPLITAPHLEAALAVWRYVEDSIKYIFGDVVADPLAARIQAARQAAPAGLSRNDLVLLLSEHVTRPRIDQALAALLAAGHARAVVEPTNGRHRGIWHAA
jgi:hypothetical protein